jgi:glycerol-3-phosphate dehydrogenase
MTSVLPRYDLVVVGGGINGAGIARDATMRGLSVLLLEKNDFGSGTSSVSSRLIHGGLRYLEYGEIPLVFESLHERRRLRRTAPHLVRRLRIKIPLYQNGKRGMFLLRLGMLAYDILSIGKSVPHHRMLSRAQILQQEPGVCPEGLLGGASYFDAQVSFAERLVLENVIAASEAGATTKNYSPVIGVNVARRQVQSVQFVDQATGEEHEVRTRMLVNAAGPWVDRVLATVNREIPRLMGGTRGSHIVVGSFSTAPKDALYVEAASDGRPFFIIPWNHQYLIGTTDQRYSGDPGDVQASTEEIDYLLAETNRVFPAAELSRQDIHYAYAGVRPLPHRARGPESAITRRHIIKKHGRMAKGLVSIVGGKLTTYRNLSEQVVDFAGKALHVELRACTTRHEVLPGGGDLERARRRLALVLSLSPAGRDRVLHIYGSRASRIADLAERQPELSESLDSGGTALAAEVVHSIREEYATNIIDVMHRRMMVGLNKDQGDSVASAIAAVAAAELGWSRNEKAAQLAALSEYNSRLRPWSD